MNTFALTEEQTTIVDAAGKLKPGESLKVIAFAGAGKTTTLKAVAKGSGLGNGVYVAFNKAIATDAKRSFPSNVDCRTMHSIAWRALSIRADDIDNRALSGPTIHAMGKNVPWLSRSTVGLSEAAQARLVGRVVSLFCQSADQKIGQSHIDPVLDQYVHKMPRPDQIKASPATYKPMIERRKAFDNLLWGVSHAVWNRLKDWRSVPGTKINHDVYLKLFELDTGLVRSELGRLDFLMLDEAQDLNPVMRSVATKSGTKLIAVGDPFQCHPPHTLVTVTGGKRVPIGELKEGDYVASYNTKSSLFSGLRTQGRRVEHVHRSHFSGDLVEIATNAWEKSHLVTPNHRCLVRFCRSDGHALYVMRRGEQYRIGVCSLYYNEMSLGPSMRARQEEADAMWILQVYEDRESARVAEEAYGGIYGLPRLMFNVPGYLYKKNKTDKDIKLQSFMDRVWAEVGDNRDRAEAALKRFGRDIAYPLWEKGRPQKMGNAGKYSFVTQACNVLSDYMSVVVHRAEPEETEFHRAYEWVPVTVGRAPYDGEVVGIQVEPTEGGRHVYLANDIVTHNSIYTWRGAEDALKLLSGQQLYLSQSFRFGKSIAHAARVVLDDKPTGGPEVRLRGSDRSSAVVSSRPSRVTLCRTNAGVLDGAIAAAKMGKRPHVVGGIKELADEVREALCLFQGRAEDLPSSSPFRRFASWSEFKDESQMLDDPAAERLIEAVENGTAKDLELLEKAHVASEQSAEVVFSTAHRAKGREWPQVTLDDDFPDLNRLERRYDACRERGEPADIQAALEEWNVLYVALTRAIDVLSLPPVLFSQLR